jgi:type VII secretion-associated serine protease mycosin
MAEGVTGLRQQGSTRARRRAGTALLGVTAVAVSVLVPVVPPVPATAAGPLAASPPVTVPAPLRRVPLAPPAVPAEPVVAPAASLPRQGLRAPVDSTRVQGPTRRDPIRDEQWQLTELGASEAWRASKGRGVTVAVIDSGVDASHPDLRGQVLPGMDLVAVDGAGKPDPVGHGTTVAALIAGRADDKRGVVGLAPEARILPVRVLDDQNRYDDALIVARGVRWAVDNGARVINLSLGGGGDSPALAAALDYAFVRDVVVVACTGNLSASSSTKVWYPAREPGVIAVTGLERDGDELWAGAISGPETALSAPAAGLVGARPDGYWRVQGTSFAAPLVAATAALVRARWPQMPAGEVVNRLLTTARDLGPAGRDDRFGYGQVDPVAALTRDVPAVARNPLDDQSSPGVVGFGVAPGLETAAPAGGQADEQLGITPAHAPTRWAARPGGAGEGPTTGRLWIGMGLLGALAAAGVLMLRQVRRDAG